MRVECTLGEFQCAHRLHRVNIAWASWAGRSMWEASCCCGARWFSDRGMELGTVGEVVVWAPGGEGEA